MDTKLSTKQFIYIGSMLFGLFFGAGNLIFPVHMGQEAGNALWPATLGFLVTGVGLPFMGIVAMGISNSDGLNDLASRVHPAYAKFFTIMLYLTIGPAFALPRTGTVSYEIGLASYVGAANQSLYLAIFSFCFFLVALLFSLQPSKIIVWVGKLINPLFLVFLAILLGAALSGPMGTVAQPLPQGLYKTQSFFKGFTEGYNTMDALASLAFGIIVAKTLHGMGVQSPADIAKGTLKTGIVSVILMSVIYGALTWMGTASLGKLTISPNGGLALAQIAKYYFGSVGAVLLAIIVTLACLKTAIGLITACSQTFEELFPGKIQYRGYVFIFTGVAFLVANMGLTQIITLAIPILMFLYPLAITLILLTFFSAICGTNTSVYRWTTVAAAVAALGDALNALPAVAKNLGLVQNLLGIYKELPFFALGMGWVLPSLLGFIIGLILRKKQKNVSLTIEK